MKYIKKNATGLLLCGFTLIELLVVVAIIAVLVALLLPALNSARESAKTIQCAAHAKQMATCMTMYSDDYNGYYPTLFMPGHQYSSHYSLWHQLLEEYMKTPEIKYCPSLSLHPDINWNDYHFLSGYGLNYCGWAWKNDSSWLPNDPDAGFGYIIPIAPRGGCVRESAITDPSNFIMLGDSNDSFNPVYYNSFYRFGELGPPANGFVPTRHKDGGNIAFTDGHIKWITAEDLMNSATKSMWTRGYD